MTKAQTLMSISILLPVKIVSSDSVMDLAAVSCGWSWHDHGSLLCSFEKGNSGRLLTVVHSFNILEPALHGERY